MNDKEKKEREKEFEITNLFGEGHGMFFALAAVAAVVVRLMYGKSVIQLKDALWYAGGLLLYGCGVMVVFYLGLVVWHEAMKLFKGEKGRWIYEVAVFAVLLLIWLWIINR